MKSQNIENSLHTSTQGPFMHSVCVCVCVCLCVCNEYALYVTTTAKDVVKECKNLCNAVVGC